MSTVKLPKIIDPTSMKQGLSHAKSAIPLVSFGRLLSIVADHDTEVNASLSWGIDQSGAALIRGELNAVFSLPCQRCLATLEVPINWVFSLQIELKHSRTGLAQVDEYCRLEENKLLLEAGETIVVLDLIEDEIMLSLPMHIKHDAIADCDSNMLSMATEYKPDSERIKESPFDVLKNFKKLE